MIDQIFGEKGWLSSCLPRYVPRQGQIEMAKAVDHALMEGRHLLAEGPTGTGKSMAYGIPAAIHAFATRTPVVIATANITLQEQLYNKDLPLIAKVLADKLEMDDEQVPPLRFQLIKGMNNYLCLDKLNEILDNNDANISSDYIEIAKWASETKTGDKSELLKEYPPQVWGDVAASSEDCTHQHCKYCDKCFIGMARGEDETEPPHVVITNYHMLYTDMVVADATGGMVHLLPIYRTLIMDEAHEAVDIAMSFNGFEFTVSKLKWLSRSLLKSEEHEANVIGRTINKAAESFFNRLQGSFSYDIIKSPLGFDGGLVYALKEAAEYAKACVVPDAGATDNARRTSARMKAMMRTYWKRAREMEEISQGVKQESGGWALPDDKVYYLEKDSKGGVSLCCKAVKVQQFLRDNVFSSKTLVATSATLSTGGDFKFIASELGLNKEEYDECQAPNPFNPEHVLLIVPAGLPPPKQQEQHTAMVGRVIERVAKDLNGRTMGLFTSYRALNQVYGYLRGKLPGIQILLQGELPKSRIIELFKKDDRAVILATSSFWQGVDIPGKTLSCVVIDKFPFLPPSDPVLKYMEEKMEAEGGSAFFDYSVPKAVIALKQGIGRLIRTEEDVGVIVLCDNRIDTTGYGKQFMKALPSGCFKSETGDLGDAKGFLEDMEKACQKPTSSPT